VEVAEVYALLRLSLVSAIGRYFVKKVTLLENVGFGMAHQDT
jgi:hypothetical protein